jgi:predicted transcriptional regulator
MRLMKLEKSRTYQRSLTKHRSRIQILAEILIISADSGASQSEIIMRAKLHYRQIKYYLDWLIATKLLEIKINQNNHVSYEITGKGCHLLITLNNIQQLMQNPDYLNIVPTPPHLN